MTEVTIALRTPELDALHTMTSVHVPGDSAIERPIKTRPASTAIELVRAREERRPTTSATKETITVLVKKLARKRRLRRRLFEYFLRKRREFLYHAARIAPHTASVTIE